MSNVERIAEHGRGQRRRRPLRVGLVGCGRIGRNIARALAAGQLPGVQLAAVTVRRPEAATAFLAELGGPAPILSLDEAAPRIDVFVEAASPDAAAEVVPVAASARRDLIALSACAFLLHPDLRERLLAAGCRLTIPSGALVGLDGVLAAREAGIERVSLRIDRPCAGIEDAPYVRSHAVDLPAIAGPTVIFHGGPADACRGFPGRTNIAAALALAAGEDAQVEVTIVGDPERTEHRHEIIASGSFGELRAVISFPADHPLDTVRIMSLSVLAELRRSAGDGEGGGSRSFHMTKRSA